MAAKTSGRQDGLPSSSRAWMCTTWAPASQARLASSAISTGVYGIAGHCARLASTPVSAQETMTGASGFDMRGSWTGG
jgi:hypothetical protein